MSGLRRWWDGLSLREQRTVAIGAAALGVILFYFLVWVPVHDRTTEMEAHLEDRRELLAYLQDARQRLGVNGELAAVDRESPDQALYALADQSARQAGLERVLRRVEPSGEASARVQFENIAFDDLVLWLGGLRDRYGITANSVTLRRTGDEGRVDAQLVLEP